ncbi:MAG: hypothetical protein Q8M01_02595 [Rubrivivax sp.]|nr:hypothetical protein [Rubrivivax sp.]
MTTPQDKDAELRQASLEHPEFPPLGRIAVNATKQLTKQRDLALAEQTDLVTPVDAGAATAFGRDHLTPRPVDQRLMMHIAPTSVSMPAWPA